MTSKIIYIFIIAVLAVGCSEKYERVNDEQFLGTWKLEGRSMFEGLTVEISKDSNGKLVGQIKQMNDNKYVLMFANIGDTWVSEISRSSNYQFRLTEKKIARELFGLYGLSSSNEFKAEFIDVNTIGISVGGKPAESSVRYIRID